MSEREKRIKRLREHYQMALAKAAAAAQRGDRRMYATYGRRAMLIASEITEGYGAPLYD